jgi:hypothetical protein
MRAARCRSLSNPRDNDIRAADHDVILKAQNAPALRMSHSSRPAS